MPEKPHLPHMQQHAKPQTLQQLLLPAPLGTQSQLLTWLTTHWAQHCTL
jgi:hypothetical protein